MRGMSDNMRGALLMMASMTAFTLNDALIKLLSGQVPLFQIIAVRGLLTSAMIGLLAWRLGALRFDIPGPDRLLIALRCVAEAAAAYFFLTALFNMEIANVTAILQALPLAVTLGSAVVFGERVGWRRMTAILVGFGGVLLIVRPGLDGFNSYSLFGLATVVCAMVRDLVTRRLSRAIPSLTVTFFTALSVTALGAVLGLGTDWVPLGPREAGLIGGASVLIIAAYLTIIMAMRVGEISFVAPFRYTGLVVAIIAGVVLFGDWPDLLTWVGSAIVVGSGLFAFWRERRLVVPRPRVPPR